MDTRVTMVPEELTRAAGKADELAGTLAGTLAGALAATHAAASLNVAQTSQSLLQYSAQITAALQQLISETQAQAELLRKSKEDTVRNDGDAAENLSRSRQQIGAIDI